MVAGDNKEKSLAINIFSLLLKPLPAYDEKWGKNLYSPIKPLHLFICCITLASNRLLLNIFINSIVE